MWANEQQTRAADGGAFGSHKKCVYPPLSAWTNANNGARLERLGPKLRGASEEGQMVAEMEGSDLH